MRSPINVTRDATFFHIRAEKLLFMCATKGNPNAVLVFEFLYAMVATFIEYFGELNPATVYRNSSVIYELIDDMLDYGFPQIVSADKLKVNARKRRGKVFVCHVFKAYIRGDGEKVVVQRHTLTQELTGQNTFRPPDLMYKKNEIFIDVIENINLLLSKEGQKLSEEAVGRIQLRTCLSGNPQCKFGFNDSIQLRESGAKEFTRSSSASRNVSSLCDFLFLKFFVFSQGVAIDDVTCHQCVKLHAFEKTREIQFVPPDGQFDLMQ